MFKKAIDAKLLQRLSGADRKKLRKAIKVRFPTTSDADIDALLPSKAEITVSKFQNRVHVYGEEGGVPIFFDVDGRGFEIFPTVYSLWKVPELLPSFLLKAGSVSQFIIGGADLMFPGISIPDEGLPVFTAGETWSIKVPGNMAPIAVGITTMSSTDALESGLHGKALRIVHCYRDSLWGSVEAPYVPNTGFGEDAVFEDPILFKSESDQINDIDNKKVGESSDTVDGNSEHNFINTEMNNGNDVAEQTAVGVGEMKLSENVVAVELKSEDQHFLSTEMLDEILNKCFLQALHTTVKDKELPIPGSTLWSVHILPCRPAGITLDIKKSSHRKLSKWLTSKSSMGVITVKEDKYKKEVVLVGVNRRHAEYMSFVPEKIVKSSDEVGSEGQAKKLVEVEEIYKASSHVRAIFERVGAYTGDYLSSSEAANIVYRYVEMENLAKPSEMSVVVLDAKLCDCLYKGVVKKGWSYPSEMDKKNLGSAFIARLVAHHRVSRGDKSIVVKGSVKKVQMMTERRQGNKKVTKVWGFESFLVDPEALAAELQKKFACSTSVGELPGKKGAEVVVQGGVIDVLAKHLIEEYGIPKGYIEVYDKTKK